MVRLIAEAGQVTREDTVLEIGPGHGILTRELIGRAKRVVAVERDAKLVQELSHTFANDIASHKLQLVAQDVRDITPTEDLVGPHYKLVANIPYYITGTILRSFLTTALQPSTIVLLMQREVAERIVAKDGKQSLLSLSVWAYGTPEIIKIVKPGAFNPPPTVDSAVLAIRSISRKNFADRGHEERFFELLHAAFSSKRKQLGTTLRAHVAEGVLSTCGIDPKNRAEQVPLEKWLALSGFELGVGS
jgi:16S rRNA (adenine1518-N6/adenine1519-N6)-dimethyltransferase